MINISVLRLSATKRLHLSTDKSCLLSICQIFESTSDVVNYAVSEVEFPNYKNKDLYASTRQGFSKWIPISEAQ